MPTYSFDSPGKKMERQTNYCIGGTSKTTCQSQGRDKRSVKSAWSHRYHGLELDVLYEASIPDGGGMW